MTSPKSLWFTQRKGFSGEMISTSFRLTRPALIRQPPEPLLRLLTMLTNRGRRHGGVISY